MTREGSRRRRETGRMGTIASSLDEIEIESMEMS